MGFCGTFEREETTGEEVWLPFFGPVKTGQPRSRWGDPVGIEDSEIDFEVPARKTVDWNVKLAGDPETSASGEKSSKNGSFEASVRMALSGTRNDAEIEREVETCVSEASDPNADEEDSRGLLDRVFGRSDSRSET